MKRIRFYSAALFGVIFVLGLGGWGAGRSQLRAPYPQTSGSVTLAGLSAPVTIKRDAHGIPHIYAENGADLYFAQGYVHAQDRFWQMEFWRHIGQGRISEIVGEPGLDSDKFIRTSGWAQIGEETIAFYRENAPEFYAYLEAYSAGVNAYLAEQGDQISINYTILSTVNEAWEIAPWTPLNTITWGIVMSHDLSGNYQDELREARLRTVLNDAQIDDVMPAYPADRPVIVPEGQPSADSDQPMADSYLPVAEIDWLEVEEALIGRPPADGFAFGRAGMVGSNNWVIGGEHTATGLPLLADDPHLAIQMPSIWYEIGLHAPGISVAGFSFAGVPGVIVGHNDHIAWGVTNLGPDVQDLYVERINPDNPLQYEFEGSWREMTTRQEVIKVNGGEDVVLEVRETHHGPLMSEIFEVDQALALRWTAQEPSRVLQAVVLLNEASSYEEFREALRYWDVPGQNFVYADVEGNIAYQSTGLVPLRGGSDGRLPVPGWDGQHEWSGYIPYEEMPAVLNPPAGYIVTANNAAAGAGYPYFISHSWADGNRAGRIEGMIAEQIAAGRPFTAEDIGRMHVDSTSLLAETYVPLLLELPAGDPLVAQAQAELAGWDYALTRDSAAASIYELTYVNLLGNLVADELGPELAEDVVRHSAYSRIFMRQLAGRPEAAWWDDQTTAAVVETRSEQLARALAEAVTWLAENHGEESAGWVWGNVHQATFRSAPLGESGIGPIERLVNRGPFPADGGEDIVNAMGWDWDEPAVVDWHPSMRMIVDMSDFDASLAVLPTGQSGHPGHPHYDDMIEMFLDGRYHPWPYSEATVAAAAVDTLILEPAP